MKERNWIILLVAVLAYVLYAVVKNTQKGDLWRWLQEPLIGAKIMPFVNRPTFNELSGSGNQ